MLLLLRQVLKTGIRTEPAPAADMAVDSDRIHSDILQLLGRALTIRHVDAGSCNGCELEIHALNNPYYNIEGRGIKFVASPRHADLLLVTGPVSRNMEIAVKRAYDATPDPKLVVATGDCACTGGIFGESYASCGRVANVIPVDVAVPGCPPPPVEILRGILSAVAASQALRRGRSAAALAARVFLDRSADNAPGRVEHHHEHPRIHAIQETPLPRSLLLQCVRLDATRRPEQRGHVVT